jgi:hypothetical protein
MAGMRSDTDRDRREEEKEVDLVGSRGLINQVIETKEELICSVTWLDEAEVALDGVDDPVLEQHTCLREHLNLFCDLPAPLGPHQRQISRMSIECAREVMEIKLHLIPFGDSTSVGGETRARASGGLGNVGSREDDASGEIRLCGKESEDTRGVLIRVNVPWHQTTMPINGTSWCITRWGRGGKGRRRWWRSKFDFGLINFTNIISCWTFLSWTNRIFDFSADRCLSRSYATVRERAIERCRGPSLKLKKIWSSPE